MGLIGLDVTFEVGGTRSKDGLRRVSLAFERAGAALKEFSKYVWPAMVEAMEQAEREQFEAEGQGPVAGGWAPLSPAYAARKAKEYPGAPINVRTGRMREAFTEGTSAFALRDTSSDESMVFGTQGLEYASYAQKGTRRMPARPPIDFGEDFEENAKRRVAAGVRAALLEGDLGQVVDVTPWEDE